MNKFDSYVQPEEETEMLIYEEWVRYVEEINWEKEEDWEDWVNSVGWSDQAGCITPIRQIVVFLIASENSP